MGLKKGDLVRLRNLSMVYGIDDMARWGIRNWRLNTGGMCGIVVSIGETVAEVGHVVVEVYTPQGPLWTTYGSLELVGEEDDI